MAEGFNELFAQLVLPEWCGQVLAISYGAELHYLASFTGEFASSLIDCALFNDLLDNIPTIAPGSIAFVVYFGD